MVPVSIHPEGAASMLSDADLQDLARARQCLEQPPLIVRMTDLIGSPIERGIEMLPAGWQDRIGQITLTSLQTSLGWAIRTLDAPSGPARDATPRWHKAAAALSGGLGGAFGLPALAVELPVSTTVILRSIADIARANGEDLSDPQVRMECISMFSMGSPSPADDAAESGYFAMRMALASAVSEAAKYAASAVGGNVLAANAPALIRLITQVAARFKIQVSHKAAAQAVPLLGAAGGALINTLFIDHFQTVSRGHFTVRRLERAYGEDAVRLAWQQLASAPMVLSGTRPLKIGDSQ